jgi:hypothetical protein
MNQLPQNVLGCASFVLEGGYYCVKNRLPVISAVTDMCHPMVKLIKSLQAFHFLTNGVFPLDCFGLGSMKIWISRS